MEAARTGVFLLFLLLVPACRGEMALLEPVFCYLLDGILVVYCIVVTALFFRQKLSNESVELEFSRPEEAPDETHQILEPSKRKKKYPRKKKKPVSTQPEQDNNTSITTAVSPP